MWESCRIKCGNRDLSVQFRPYWLFGGSKKFAPIFQKANECKFFAAPASNEACQKADRPESKIANETQTQGSSQSVHIFLGHQLNPCNVGKRYSLGKYFPRYVHSEATA